MADRLKLTVQMDVTEAQAVALRAMFEYWTYCGRIGRSREVAFYVDGDGNFQPRCVVTTDKPVPELTDELRELAIARDTNGSRTYDFDQVAWKLRQMRGEL